MDFSLLLQAHAAWNGFQQRHPKFLPFLRAAKPRITEGAVIEITVTPPDGAPLSTNLRIAAEDLQAIALLTELASKNG